MRRALAAVRPRLLASRRALATAVRLALAEIVVPVGVAAAAGLALAATISPRWRAAGMPYFLGYGKNVEAAAVVGALAAGAATQWLVRSRRGFAACLLVAVLGLALAAAAAPVAPLLDGWPQLLAVAGLATALGRGRRGGHSPAEAPIESAPARDGAGGKVATAPLAAGARREFPAALLVGALAAAAFAFTVGPPPLTIDTYHHGEVLSTAVDLLRGGRPFATLLWPHGFHDSGLTAAWILATGKVGTSPVALAWASCCALGVVAVYLVARRLLGSRAAALAVCLVAAAAPLLTDQAQIEAGSLALYQSGELFFVVLGFVAVTSRRRDLVAGLCFGLAYLFRIETALYGTLAALAVIAHRDLFAAEEPWARGVKKAAGSVLRLFGGAGLVLAAAWLILGWPGAEWYAYTLGDLPRYHRDAMGFPLPWPRPGVARSPLEVLWLNRTLARLLLTLLLLVQALRELLERPRPRARAASERTVPDRTASLLFVAVFAAAAAKTAIDRSDVGHVTQWSELPLLAAACLAFAAWRERRSWTRPRAGLALVVLIALLDFGNLGFKVRALRAPAAAAAAARERWDGLVEHLAPNPPAGGCADRTFTPGEGRLAANRRFIADTCAAEATLRAHGVTRLVIADSASWYYVRFRMPWPTRYFAMARAYTPPRQLELVRELRASRPQALLLAHGYGALGDFDIPDAVRVPVVDAYLRGRRRGVAVTPTPLGDLFFWDEPEACMPAPLPGAPAPRAELTPELVAYQPVSGLLFARGWALDGAAQGPLAALTPRDAPPGAVADLELGRNRDELATGLHREALRHAGWELAVRGWRPRRGASPGPEDALVLEAVAQGGGTSRVRLDLTGARILGPLRGAEWDGLGAAIGRAAAMGRADRAGALAAAAAPGQRVPPCGPRAAAGERR
ncbi:MAG TPA: glycosyltransferase family 39 protein [Thermoanaerobaculia bacterium]|nr:glycosyltransferase family 39 protein [Thermoanaerobaculia bacterium]